MRRLVDPLDEENGPRWLANLTRLAASVATLNAAHAVARHARVLAVLKSVETPTEIQTLDQRCASQDVSGCRAAAR